MQFSGIHFLIDFLNFQGNWLSLPLDTGRKLNVYKTFRRHLGRLVNVSCTLNVRPVSRGQFSRSNVPDIST